MMCTKRHGFIKLAVKFSGRHRDPSQINTISILNNFQETAKKLAVHLTNSSIFKRWVHFFVSYKKYLCTMLPKETLSYLQNFDHKDSLARQVIDRY